MYGNYLYSNKFNYYIFICLFINVYNNLRIKKEPANKSADSLHDALYWIYNTPA